MVKKPINPDVQKIAELAMAKSLKDAKAQVEALLPPIIEHLFKIFIWGDHYSWRTEIKGWLGTLADTKISLKSRDRLTKAEYLNSISEFKSLTRGSQTVSRYIINVFHDMNKSMPKNLNEQAIGEKVLKLVDEFAFYLSSDNRGVRLNRMQVDQLINQALLGWTPSCKL